MVLQASNIGVWDWNLLNNEIYLSPQWKIQLGYADDELPNRYEEWESRLHPAALEFGAYADTNPPAFAVLLRIQNLTRNRQAAEVQHHAP